MLVLILSIIVIGLAGLERRIYIKSSKGSGKIRLFIGVLIISLLFYTSYIITDTAIGVFYVFLGIIAYILIGLVKCRSNVEWLKYLSYIMGIPFMLYILIKASQNMLIDPIFILFLLNVINMILSYSYKQRGTKKENISLAIGIVIAAALIFSYFNLPGSEERLMLKQELVAQKYLEEELGMYGLEVFYYSFTGSLRGEETTVRAYDPSRPLILLTYKNNKIISYDIKDS